MISLDHAPTATDLIEQPPVDEWSPAQARNSSFLGHPLSVHMLPARTPALKCLLKIKFNGAGGTQTYLGFTHFGVLCFSKHQSAGDVQ
jgi:hypothetical protein